jgi:hypothetical protein
MRNIDFVKRYVRYCWTWRGKSSGRHSNLSYRVVGGLTVLYSYHIPIAAYYDGIGFLVDSDPRSPTTARHIGLLYTAIREMLQNSATRNMARDDQFPVPSHSSTVIDVPDIAYPLSPLNREYFITRMKNAIAGMLSTRYLKDPRSYHPSSESKYIGSYLKAWQDARQLWNSFAGTEHAGYVTATSVQEWVGIDPMEDLRDHQKALVLGMMRYFDEEQPPTGALSQVACDILHTVQQKRLIVYRNKRLYIVDEAHSRNKRYKTLTEFTKWVLKKLGGDIDGTAWLIVKTLQNHLVDHLPVHQGATTSAVGSLVTISRSPWPWWSWPWWLSRSAAYYMDDTHILSRRDLRSTTAHTNQPDGSQDTVAAVLWNVHCPICDETHTMLVGESLDSYCCPNAEPDNRIPVIVNRHDLERLKMEIMLALINNTEIRPSPQLPKVEVYDPEEDNYAHNEPSQMQAL